MTDIADSPILITGMFRSGTTLLEKLLHAHPELNIASQPFPALYHRAKAAFLASRALGRRYPLDHLFLENAYTPAELAEFLDSYMFSAHAIERLFDALAADEKGLWTPEILDYRDRVEPGRFVDVARQLLRRIPEVHPKPSATRVGSKEILCEEFVPYLLARGWRVILVVRDPRSVVASSTLGEYSRFTGDIRPTLYTLRNWRKSVAIALACKATPGFAAVRYEDIVTDAVGEVNRSCDAIGVTRVADNFCADGLVTQGGEPWRGNSSFGALDGVDSTAPSRSWARLPPASLAYIETVCLPELVALDYPLEHVHGFDPEIVMRFVEPYEVRHQRFDPDYSTTTDRVAAEIERYERLVGAELSSEDARLWFLYEHAYRSLRDAALSA